jgi:hypothetical protein
MAVIELAKPGQEATTYELIITVANAASTVNGIISTQMLTPLRVTGCTDDNCPSDSVNISNPTTFNDTDGPYRFTVYGLTLMTISIVACLLFTPFLPRSKEECHELKERGEKIGESSRRGYFSLFLAAATVMVFILFIF